MSPETSVAPATSRPIPRLLKQAWQGAASFLARTKRTAFTLGAVLVLGWTTLFGVTAFADVLGVGALVGPGHVDSFTVSCGTSATLIQSPFGQVSYAAQVDDAAGADVFFGDSAVTTGVGTPKGAGEDIGGNVRKEYCRVASGTETVRVRAMTATEQSSLAGQIRYFLTETFNPEALAARTD